MITLIAVVLFSQNGPIPANDLAPLRQSLDSAVAQWSQVAPHKYSYTLKEGGPFGYTEYRISVDGSSCTARSRWAAGRATPWKAATCEGHTIAAVFEVVRRSLDQPQERVEVEFDSSHGFPSNASFEPFTDITDSSGYFLIESFKVRDRKAK